MEWPQVVMIGWIGVGLGLDLARHGKERLVTDYIWTGLVAWSLFACILYVGGFWS